jgi:formyl-CoA transferase
MRPKAMFGGRPLERTGNRSVSGAYADLIRCAGSGVNDYVYLMLPPDNAEPFDALVEIIGRPELRTDARFAAPPARAKNAEALTSIIEVWARERDKRQVMAAFARRGIPCGAVLDTAEVLDDAHLQERGTVRDLEHPTRGRFKMIGSPLRLSDSPTRAWSWPRPRSTGSTPTRCSRSWPVTRWRRSSGSARPRS